MNAPEAQARLLTRKEGAIGWIIISNPTKLNALSYDMWRDMPAAFDQFVADNDVRMIVLTGDGERAFASGADISQFERQRSSGDALAAYNRTLKIATTALLDCPKPTIARVRGICIGGGLALTLDCDLRFCSDDAVFRMPAARLGLGYEFEGIKRMVEVIGPTNASDLFFSARKVDGHEAKRLGIVNDVFPSAEFDRRFMQYCTLIAENAPLTMAAAKRTIRELAKDTAQRDMAKVQAMYEACFASEDYAEGRRAFMEKRTPKFRGR